MSLAPFSAPYAPADAEVVKALLERAERFTPPEEKVAARARGYVEAIRSSSGGVGAVEDFMREFGLSTREGLALMVLAEALLRVPDAATQDRLIEDKIGAGDWADREPVGDGMLMTASAWALGLSSRIIRPGETPTGVLQSLVKRVGAPAVRTATRQAMRFLGRQFVLGETIEDALERARAAERKGYRYSYDMLGEGARTRDDAERYRRSYEDAIEKIGRQAGNKALPERPGISVKLSALHPRYHPTHREAVLRELVPVLADLARKAQSFDLNFTVDAEEAERLELSLDVIDATVRALDFRGWTGFGLAVQAYGKRTLAVIEHIDALCAECGIRMMVRLVKGAYWDTEIKLAQEKGLAGFPVHVSKPATDLNYLAVAHEMLARRARIFPQFATHNALTVATILEMAGADRSGFEFQRLHGMGESLYEAVARDTKGEVGCRIYAPVGGYRDLLAYLVRRLLENGANSSFVAKVGDARVPVDELLTPPAVELRSAGGLAPSGVVAPEKLFGARKNSRGLEFGDRRALAALLRSRDRAPSGSWQAAPREGLETKAASEVRSPGDGTVVGTVRELTAVGARALMDRAGRAVRATEAVPARERASKLRRAADALEAHEGEALQLLLREAGKTLDDAIAEVREAVDFLRFYADEAERVLGAPIALPGPTGEENRLHYRSRGVALCISPWNFPLAIFLGQVAAALAGGNVVVAKPAEQTPLVAAFALRLLHEAGFAEESLWLASGEGDVGAALVSHPATALVAFTGSTETAFAINRALAARDTAIAPLIAETGGVNAMIVDATALPEQVADDVVRSAFRSAGQRCSALRLLFVQEDVADRMIEMIQGAVRELVIGDPSDIATDIGPVIDGAQERMLRDHMDAMRAGGGKVLFEAELPASLPQGGHFVPPAIVELSGPEKLRGEVFGPILHVVRWRAGELEKVAQAIERTGYGLTLGIHSRIEATQRFVAERLDVGNVYVNRNMIGAIVGSQPFGGSGLSGTGPKAGGPNYLARFVREQVVSTNTAAAGGNAALIAGPART
ncbi:bifunctional proline dehydrogenase/L-glutamate gamma-semialdehyde dehydrogenase PutA [Aureimonas sp. AU4]|uniref:bifunctional proline dehydrogenase/L-glutamate gamma-semialdehyde dehydrogenase PutA n=1 Tax=Aureimonas sp. AU4 TaxID=1638163 RepID=UPI000786267E|nr:bifunctional proline dehydrogenase/L-glutamate gamma-semialdehyde dehydrogenase PutA [Aureimonas sp. AU4]